MTVNRLLSIIVFIQANLDSDLSLDSLASHSGLSSRQIHRLFQDHFGETPKQYTQRLRLERAAFLLTFQVGTILDVAISVGYESHEVFTRAFKRHFSVKPKEFRLRSNVQSDQKDRIIETGIEDSLTSKVKVVEMAPQNVAFIRSTGPYEDIDPGLWSQITNWLQKKKLSSSRIFYGVGLDAPGITPPEKLRFDAAVSVDGQFQGDEGIGYQSIGGGSYAMLTHIGPLNKLTEAYQALPALLDRIAGYKPIWLPVIEIYHANPMKGLDVVLHTDICIPMERR